jgi:hypothetical protein
MKRKCLFLLLVIAGLSMLSETGLAVIPDQFLEGKVTVIESQIGDWERTVTVLETLTFLVAAFAVVVAIMQAASGAWVRAAVAILSGASALIVAYNQNFYAADQRAYGRLAKTVKHKVDAFRDEVEGFGPLDDATLKAFRKKFSELKSEIENLEEEMLKGQTTSGKTTMSWPGISSAYAEDAPAAVRAPEWLKKPPQDDRNLYFVGVAEGTSVEAARTNALASARNVAAKTIETAARKSDRLKTKEEYVADFTQAVTSPAEVVNTFVTPNIQSGTYRASTLLRLPKSVAAFNAEAFFVEKGLPYDQLLLRGIESDTSALSATSEQATQVQRTAVNNGLVYIQITREEDRPLAEALRQNLSKIISAPGVEKSVAPATPNVVRYFRPEDKKLADKVKTAAESFLNTEGYQTSLSLEDLSGTAVKGAPQQIEIWLGEIAVPTPRVYLEVEQGTPAANVAKLKSALEANGFAVPKVEQITGIPKREARVFYYKASDAQKADALVQSLPDLGIQTSRDSATKIAGPTNARPAHFDLRVSKDAFRNE